MEDWGNQSPWLGFRDLSSGIWVERLGSKDSGFGFRVRGWALGLRV